MNKKYPLLILVVIIVGYFSINFVLGKNNNPFGIKDLLSTEHKQIIKKSNHATLRKL